jgi:hypothetical protein
MESVRKGKNMTAKQIKPVVKAVKTIRIQPKERKDMTLPYPYFIDAKGNVGRQDFWKGEPLKLICFAKKNEAKSSLDFDKFWKNPSKCIGLYPVFEHSNGEWFTYKDPIESVDLR